jgi:hypothetical protein
MLALLPFMARCDEAIPQHLTYERLTQNTVITGHGTCFAVNKTQVLTAYHNLIDEGKSLNCWILIGGTKYPLTLSKKCERIDVALCDVKGCLLEPYVFSTAKEGKIQLSGFSRGIYADYKGEISQPYWSNSIRTLMKVKFDHGLSGAPVTKDGKVVGMAVAGVVKDGDIDYTQGLYVPSEVLMWFLKEPKP